MVYPSTPNSRQQLESKRGIRTMNKGHSGPLLFFTTQHHPLTWGGMMWHCGLLLWTRSPRSSTNTSAGSFFQPQPVTWSGGRWRSITPTPNTNSPRSFTSFPETQEINQQPHTYTLGLPSNTNTTRATTTNSINQRTKPPPLFHRLSLCLWRV